MQSETSKSVAESDGSSAIDSPESMASLFSPKSIAIIGATEKQGAVGRTVVENLQKIKFPGAVYPVNPKRDTILGLKAYSSIGAIGQPIDVAMIITPPTTVPGIMADCVSVGVKYGIIISAGFKEAGHAGLELEKSML